MKVYKFGGASVKDAEGVKNLTRIVKTLGEDDLVIVISAMGKTTNAMEDLLHSYLNSAGDLHSHIKRLRDFHFDIVEQLFGAQSAHCKMLLERHLEHLNNFFEHNRSQNYDFVYDQVVGYGELLSTTLVSSYLQHEGIINEWLDIRDIIITDRKYRDAGVDFDQTSERITAGFEKGKIYLTQGFLGGNVNGFTTTLGREGSDYTGAILAWCLSAESLTIWKDVEGVLSGDPRIFEDVELLQNISYNEAIELAFYGASVIHPKTLQPLQDKNIPLFVRSFLNPEGRGTEVGRGTLINPLVPCRIRKRRQILLSIKSKDFSFVTEENIGHIFALFHKYQVRVNLMQNSAISFTVCLEDKYCNWELLTEELREHYKIRFNSNVTLYTTRHYTSKNGTKNGVKGKVLLEQYSRETKQWVVTDEE